MLEGSTDHRIDRSLITTSRNAGAGGVPTLEKRDVSGRNEKTEKGSGAVWHTGQRWGDGQLGLRRDGEDHFRKAFGDLATGSGPPPKYPCTVGRRWEM